MAIERRTLSVGTAFDAENQGHVDGVMAKLAEAGLGSGWDIQSFDPSTGKLTVTRRSLLTKVEKEKGNSYRVELRRGVKPSDGEKIAAELESDPAHAGHFMTAFDPYLAQATLTKLNEEEVRARGAVATALGVKPWDVQVKGSMRSGFTVGLPAVYVPSKFDKKLDEVAAQIVGRPGWYWEADPSKMTGKIIPGELPTFPGAYPFDFASLPKNVDFDSKELWRIPLGVSLGGRGRDNTLVDMHLDDSVGALLVGLAGSGKSQPLDTRIPVPVSDRFPDGWATVGGLDEGDLVYAADGSQTRVIGFSPVHEADVYEVELSDGQVIRTHGNHVWKASNTSSRQAHTPKMLAARSERQASIREQASKVRAVAASSDARLSATLSDIARMVNLDEEALRLQELPVAHLAKDAVLQGGSFGAIPARVYPIDEVLTLLAERLEEQANLGKSGRPLRPAEVLVTTKEMARSLRSGSRERANWGIRTARPIDGPAEALPVDPYVLGAWLGVGAGDDGARGSVRPEVLEEVSLAGYGTLEDERLRAGLDSILEARGGTFDKRIPATYLRASELQRLAVLQGLMDTRGQIHTGGCKLTLSKQDLADDIVELIRSLGIRVNVSTAIWTGTVISFTTTTPVFRLPGKSSRQVVPSRSKQGMLYVVDIRKAGRAEMRCLKVEHPEHLYLTDGFVPTHNSVATQGIVFNALARGWRLALINTVDKATDFAWAKPFVADGMWGCDSVAQSVAVAKRVGEEGERLGALLSEYGASKWQELPALVREANPPLLLVADELAALLTADPVPPGLSKEMKEMPEFIQMQQDVLESKLLATSLSKIPAVYRAAGIRTMYLTQQPSERYGFSAKLKGNLPHRIMLGTSPSDGEKANAFRTPEKVPDVPVNIAQDDKAARGVGLAHLDGSAPVVFKGFFAPLDAYLQEADRRGFRTSLSPAPSESEIDRLVPRIDGERAPSGAGVDPSSKPAPAGVAQDRKFGGGQRKLEPWEVDPETGEPLDSFQRANMARKMLAQTSAGGAS